jgi:hypothetical protein
MLGLTQSIESDCARESTAFSWPVWAEPPRRLATGVHPVVIRVVLSAIAWFLAVTWLNFAADIEVDLDLAVVTGFFVMFLTLFLLTASLVVNDPRWRQRKTSFAEFLDGEVAIDTYTDARPRGSNPYLDASDNTRCRWHADRLCRIDGSFGVVMAAWGSRNLFSQFTTRRWCA